MKGEIFAVYWAFGKNPKFSEGISGVKKSRTSIINLGRFLKSNETGPNSVGFWYFGARLWRGKTPKRGSPFNGAFRLPDWEVLTTLPPGKVDVFCRTKETCHPKPLKIGSKDLPYVRGGKKIPRPKAQPGGTETPLERVSKGKTPKKLWARRRGPNPHPPSSFFPTWVVSRGFVPPKRFKNLSPNLGPKKNLKKLKGPQKLKRAKKKVNEVWRILFPLKPQKCLNKF